jgi:hypothetical protein
MKHIKRLLVLTLVALLSLTALIACAGDAHASPEALAKAYVSAGKSLDAAKVLELMNLTDAEKTTLQTQYQAVFDGFSEAQKAQIKSGEFVKYEKTSGTDTTEVGKLTSKVKTNGEGEYKEETETINFIKVEDKWYVVSPLSN